MTDRSLEHDAAIILAGVVSGSGLPPGTKLVEQAVAAALLIRKEVERVERTTTPAPAKAKADAEPSEDCGRCGQYIEVDDRYGWKVGVHEACERRARGPYAANRRGMLLGPAVGSPARRYSVGRRRSDFWQHGFDYDRPSNTARD